MPMTRDARDARRRRSRRRGRGDEGAALVEFALVAPVLFLILFGIMEFGWAFSQVLDIRHGAREGARLVAVNYREGPTQVGDAQLDFIIAETCGRLSNADAAEVTIDHAGSAVGQIATVEITRDLQTLTGFLDFALGGISLKSSAETRIEQTATWAEGTRSCP